MDNNNWFTEWFNTPYYHILYANRNDNDAQVFMKNLVRFLNIPKQASILDLPCGKGRHAIFLNSLGYTVTGADLSKNSIDFAKQFENDTLQFYQKDMREPFTKTYNYIFNLFTSFGLILKMMP
jgi:2-polyprenyl-3-methyl-5-hydroxy-6-metoxy-1,4-benzoquinol methylase